MGIVRRTPLRALNDVGLIGKLECLQNTGSFKLRGAANMIRSHNAPRGVLTASSGNHGRAVAWLARMYGIPAYIVFPSDGSKYKLAAIRRLGAIIATVDFSTDLDAALAELSATHDPLFVPAYDHTSIIAGQGTVGLEIIQSCPEVETIVVPLGGGGLISGIAIAVKSQAPQVRIVGVEPEAGDDGFRSLTLGHRVSIPRPETICDGARGNSIGELTFPLIQTLVDEIVTVPDECVIEAMIFLARRGLVVEPTGALSVSGALQLRRSSATVCVLSGGNISRQEHQQLTAKGGGASHAPSDLGIG